MAEQIGFVGADPFSRLLIGRIRQSTKMQWRRLLIWFALVSVSSIGVGLLLPTEGNAPDSVVQAVVLALAGSVGYGACVYCLAIFALDRRIRPLLAAAAFSTLGSGVILQNVVDLHGSSPCVYGWISLFAWLVSAVLMVGESYSDTKWRAANRLQSIGQFVVAGLAVVAFPLVVLPYVLDTTILFNISRSPSGAAICHIVAITVSAATAALFCWALVANYRRYMNTSDGLSGLGCYFLTASITGLLLCSAYGARFDMWYMMGQICFVWSWLALVVGSGLENAFANKEAGDRLEELETLHEVSWSLVGARDVKELLDLFVTTLVNKLGTRIAAVYLLQDRDSPELAAMCGAEESRTGAKYSLVASGPWPGFHSGHTAKAFTSREVQVANDVFVDVEFVPWRVVAGENGCAASIPLVDRDSCIGVLDIYFSDSSQLTSARLRLMATIAASAASAIKYATAKEADIPFGEAKAA